MSGELGKVSTQHMLQNLIDDVKRLREVIKDMDDKIAGLEKRMVDLEQSSRMDDVIITGLTVKPRSYAKDIDVPSAEEQQSIDSQE